MRSIISLLTFEFTIINADNGDIARVRGLQRSGRRGLKGNLFKTCLNLDLQKHSGTVRVAIQLPGPWIKKSEQRS